MVTHRIVAAGLGALLALTVSGCSTGQEDEAGQISSQFHQALQEDDGAAACAVLAPRTREEVEQSASKDCAQAVLEESVPTPGPHRQVQAFGNKAQVRAGTEVTFLSRFPSGWKVVAAGCAKRADDTYDCQISGG